MPTSTFLSYDLVNVGPLTTTFTAPASCATAANLGLASRVYPYNGILSESCVTFESQSDCAPSGSQIDAISMTRGKKVFWDFGWAMPYYSPGLHCPDGFTTAGVAEMSANGESSVTGIFSRTAFEGQDTWPEPTPFALPPVNIVASALEEGETAVICCKSGFTADPINGCYSTYPATLYTATDFCRRSMDLDYVTRGSVNVTFTYNGLTVHGIEWSSTESPTTLPYALETGRLDEWTDDAWSNVLIGYTSVPMHTLIHRGANDGAATGSVPSETTATGSSDGAEGTGDKDSGATARSRVSTALVAVAGIFILKLILI